RVDELRLRSGLHVSPEDRSCADIRSLRVLLSDLAAEGEDLTDRAAERCGLLLDPLDKAGLCRLQGVAREVRHLPDQVVLRGPGLRSDVANLRLDDAN